MAVSPKQIIDQQLELLAKESVKGMLTFEQCQSLERLIRMDILLRMKKPGKDYDPTEMEDISTDELKQLRDLLKE